LTGASAEKNIRTTMDLLEIRKKAKEKKEAEARAKEAEAGPKSDEGTTPDDAARPKPVKKRSRKKAAPIPADTGQNAETATKAPAKAAPEAAEVLHEPAGTAGVVSGRHADEGATAGVPSTEEAAGPGTATPGPSPAQEEAYLEPSEGDVSDGTLLGDEEEEDSADEDIIEYLAFMLSGEEYAVKVEDVDEIIRLQKITMVPRAYDFVEGIISLRGVIIPVFDIKKRLGLETGERGRSTRIVIVSDDENPQGIIVDRVTGVARLRESAIEPPPAVIGGVEGEYLDGVGRIADRLIILFNTKKVLEMDGGTS
jgi:purine-binding chemotaxis protein CheW